MDSIKRKGRDMPRPSSTQQTPLLSQAPPRSMYSMACLEQQIALNLDPLLQWACETDLTAENIVFLRSVRDFKKKWITAESRGDLDETQQREQFEDAALIWFKLINPLTARFNINIDYRTFLDLEQIFRGVRYEPFFEEDSSKSVQSENVIAPWVDYERPTSQYYEDCKISDIDKLYVLPITEIHLTDGSITSLDASLFQVPDSFTTDVFDQAYDIVRTDVFHNTWLRYEARFSRPEPLSQSYPLPVQTPKCHTRTCNILCIPIRSCQKVVKALYRRIWPAQPNLKQFS
jgi:hypothetical protein